MKMHCKKIIGLPVETESGQSVGKVVDIVLDIDTQDVVVYIVAIGRFLQGLVGAGEELDVLPTHVRSITTEKMVIADLAGKQQVSPEHAAQELNTGVVGAVPRPIATEVE